jgi:hypothetical protein
VSHIKGGKRIKVSEERILKRIFGHEVWRWDEGNA